MGWAWAQALLHACSLHLVLAMGVAKAELLQLLEKPQLAGIPVSVCVCVGGGGQLMTTAPVKRYQLE